MTEQAKRMDPELKAKWVKALRSGEYEQARETLRTRRPEGHFAYCCLGVLMDITGEAHFNYTLIEQLGVRNSTFIKMNDDDRKSFSEIADYIESPESGL